MDKTVADPMIGRLLDGRYRVGPRIARGGMATVYEATDLRLDRICALKIMHTGLGDDDDFAARFVREARSAARLSHPNVVGVYDQGDDEGTVFLAMEYVPGHTLRDLIRQEAPMAPATALGLLEHVLAALSAAHQAGLIHRDVKPENVLLADDGRIKVADFGLARAVSAETQHTATGGILIGTVSYLSPELVVDGTADARSDVYAAGVLLYEMLTGRKPHEGDSPIQVAYKHVHEDVPPPSEIVPGLPSYVDALVARATARDRGLRPADARVLLHQVRRVRGALDQGVLDDPELAADIAPTVKVLPAESIDYVTDDAPTILAPADAAGSEQTTAFPRPAGLTAARPAEGSSRATSAPPGRGGRPRRSRRGPIVLALVLLLAASAALAGWWFGIGRYTTTPGVINLSVEQAGDRMADAGLALEVSGRQYSETITAGSIISTDPRAGADVLDGGTVTAVVSRGPERYEVPLLKGTRLPEAETAIEEQNLVVGDVTERFNEEVARGIVLRSTPRTGTEMPRDGVVDLVVSKGPRPIKVPDFTGKDADTAEEKLTALGLAVEVRTRNDVDVSAGDVIRQLPDSGRLFRGDEVQLVVSEGPVMVEVPRVNGVGEEEAIDRLEAAGFEVRTENSDLYVGLGYVVSSDPRQGTMAPEGSTITLFLV